MKAKLILKRTTFESCINLFFHKLTFCVLFFELGYYDTAYIHSISTYMQVANVFYDVMVGIHAYIQAEIISLRRHFSGRTEYL